MQLTPEHDKRDGETLHPDIEAAYRYVESIVHTADNRDGLSWHGWALREAFLAGMSERDRQVDRKRG